MVHPSFRCGLLTRFGVRFLARSVAGRTSRGCLVRRRDQALGKNHGMISGNSFTVVSSAPDFFQHPGIDVTAADDGDVQFRTRELFTRE